MIMFRNTSVDSNTTSIPGAAGVALSQGSVYAAYGNVFGHSPDWSGTSDPAGISANISTNPLYISPFGPDPALWDLHLQPGSPLLDAGDTMVLDADLSISDIGAYGGPGSNW